MLYQFYEMNHAAMAPLRQAAGASRDMLQSPVNPFSSTLPARTAAAACEMFINATKRYGKPEFSIETVQVDGVEVPIVEAVVARRAFCDLLHFKRQHPIATERRDPAVLIIAPMSGHFATLLRGTVAAMLKDHEVYITDWIDARDVPLSKGRFGLDEYVDTIMDFCDVLHKRHKERPAAMGVCQPGVPLLAATSLMAEDKAPFRPAAITLMGSPIDTRISPTEPNTLATTRPITWFRDNVITTVPWPHRAFLRRVYPGFLQLSGFMAMNIDRHMDAHVRQFRNLIRGDGESAASHRRFYDEYLSVMDLTAEFYLETVHRVFQKHELARGEFYVRGRRVNPSAVRDIGLMTIEGGKDDITGLGQTEAAQTLCEKLPKSRRLHYIQEEVGHYGVFNGGRWRSQIQPRVAEFILSQR